MSDWRRAFADPLPTGFYGRPTLEVARDLLGTVLLRRGEDGRFRAARIIETEAYVAGDPANHAFRGLTRKNWTMFAGPGHLYVYRIHQVHCANVTTHPGEAVLIRAAQSLSDPSVRMGGPGLLCRAFSFTKAEDGLDLMHGPVRLVPGVPRPDRIRVTGRIGIREGRELPLRFVERDPVEGGPRISKTTGRR